MSDKENEQLRLEGTEPTTDSQPQTIQEQQNLQEKEQSPDPNQLTIDDYNGETILEKQTVESLLKEAKESEQKSSKKKSIITNVIFLIVNIVLMAFIVKNLIDSASGNVLDVFAMQGKRMWWLAVGLGLLVLFFICETMMFWVLIKKTTGKSRLFLSYRLAAVGKYYDFITPTQLGGQPSQIIRLTKSGVGAGLATSLPIIKLIVYNIVYTIVSAVLYFFAVPLIPISGSLQSFLMALIKIVGAIGLIVTVISCFLYFIIGNGKLIGRSFVRFIVRTGYKLHIVKNYRQTFDKILTHVEEYQSSIKYLKKHKGTLAISVILSLVECITFALIPFTVTMAFGSFELSGLGDALACMLITMSSYYLCLMVSTCLPLPGGTGTMEICYIFLYAIGAYSVGDNIVWALIFYRVLTYYLVILQGFLHIVIESILKATRARKKPAVA